MPNLQLQVVKSLHQAWTSSVIDANCSLDIGKAQHYGLEHVPGVKVTAHAMAAVSTGGGWCTTRPCACANEHAAYSRGEYCCANTELRFCRWSSRVGSALRYCEAAAAWASKAMMVTCLCATVGGLFVAYWLCAAWRHGLAACSVCLPLCSATYHCCHRLKMQEVC